ncbi:alpha-(1,3)-fucosyltransferase C-like isoform X2 [Spodoptera litura]|nr:alpha-(1,3)-fucosyltransferase C-like isoform X2 [Spodoptera litura]XP_022823473.1 alpha-(1,3)-fucosyltransferase C-like isoform X2 [Spodoptera litura]XP_022823474.1 alpha-(1,3)-fucosyltransferase C-like isoform X2 [Spodoptera litura]XP_022823476.1 alpha-(1,3)-fucosyltransferase C-like isoform X2 [Spodoptera litura]
MSWNVRVTCSRQFGNRLSLIKFFFFISCTNLFAFLFWSQETYRQHQSSSTESLVQEAITNVGHDYRYTDLYRKVNTLPEDFKYILLWTEKDYAPFYFYGEGQIAFLKNKCQETKCYVVADRNFFGGNLTRFDAIAFNGRNMNSKDLPKTRSRHQQYVYFNTESADNYPVCNKVFNRYFNWTSSYRIDSDIPFGYILIKNKLGDIVGPNKKMSWVKTPKYLDEEYIDMNRIRNKTKAAAWFVSNCRSRSGRLSYVKALKNALKPFNLTVDIYGKCGKLKCSKTHTTNCSELLQKDYYFYMSMENSFAEDYVTEKLLTALRNDVVPIVYGGADYNRFLPPGSYIDATKHHVIKLAAMINDAMHSPKLYNQYFWWKKFYTYDTPSKENICALCTALHNKTMIKKNKIYDDFRSWWYPAYAKRCH